MQKSKHDVWVGIFVMLGAAAIVFLALKAGNLLTLSFDSGYKVAALFDNIGGLKPKAAVKSAGVVVGRVTAITFDNETFQAKVEIEMNKGVAFPKDTSAKILTAGLLGEQYIGVTQGGDELLRCGEDEQAPLKPSVGRECGVEPIEAGFVR